MDGGRYPCATTWPLSVVVVVFNGDGHGDVSFRLSLSHCEAMTGVVGGQRIGTEHVVILSCRVFPSCWGFEWYGIEI
jgi:hypothetical protein